MKTITLQQLYSLRKYTEFLHGTGFSTKKKLAINNGTATSSKGCGIEFCEHRLFQQGDSIRHIDWALTARKCTPWVKIPHEEKDNNLIFLIDLTNKMHFSSQRLCKTFIALQTFSLLGWQGVNQGYQIGALFLTESGITKINPQIGENHFCKMLNMAIHAQKNNSNNGEDPIKLAKAIHVLRKSLRSHCNIVLISDFIPYNECTSIHLNYLASEHNVHAIRVTDPFEFGELSQGIYPIHDKNQYTTLYINDKNTHTRFVQSCQKQLAETRHRLLSANISVTDLNTKQPAVTQLCSLPTGST